MARISSRRESAPAHSSTSNGPRISNGSAKRTRTTGITGVVKLNKVTFRPITEEATRVAALRNGEVDLIDSVSGELADELDGQDQIVIARTPSTDTIHLTFNFTRPPFNVKEARWAVAHAIDAETIVNDILQAGQRIAAPIPEGTVGYDAELVAQFPNTTRIRRRSCWRRPGIAEGTKIEFKMNPAWFAKLDQVGRVRRRATARRRLRGRHAVPGAGRLHRSAAEPQLRHRRAAGQQGPQPRPELHRARRLWHLWPGLQRGRGRMWSNGSAGAQRAG